MNPEKFQQSASSSSKATPELSRRYFLKKASQLGLAATSPILIIPNANEATAQIDENIEFRRPHSFTEFPAEIVPTKFGIKAVMDDDFTRDYPTRIKAAMEQGAVFGGKFALAEIGNGTMGQFGFIVDMTNGKVYRIPYAFLGYEFRLDSRLLIINPKSFDDEFGQADQFQEEYWEWDGKSFIQLIE